MYAKQNLKPSASVEEQLSSVNMSERQCSQPLPDVRIAEAFAEVFTWGGSLLSRQRGNEFAMPGPKY